MRNTEDFRKISMHKILQIHFRISRSEFSKAERKKIILQSVFVVALGLFLYGYISCAAAKNNTASSISSEETSKETRLKSPELKNAALVDMQKIMTSRVAAIPDPLTFVLKDGETVRLVSLDTPGLYDVEPAEIAIRGKNALEEVFIDETVHVYQGSKKGSGATDRMGHPLVHIVRERDNLWAQGVLLENGFARVRSTKDNLDLVSLMLALEERARKGEQGLWSLEKYGIFDAMKAENAFGEFHLVQGKVYSIATVGNTIYVNFGSDWKTDFTIAIPSKIRQKFIARKTDPMSWKNYLIRVRGFVENYNGPYIEIDHPERIEILEIIGNGKTIAGNDG